MAGRHCAVCGTENPSFSSNRGLAVDYCRGCKKIQPFGPPNSSGTGGNRASARSLRHAALHNAAAGAPPVGVVGAAAAAGQDHPAAALRSDQASDGDLVGPHKSGRSSKKVVHFEPMSAAGDLGEGVAAERPAAPTSEEENRVRALELGGKELERECVELKRRVRRAQTRAGQIAAADKASRKEAARLASTEADGPGSVPPRWVPTKDEEIDVTQAFAWKSGGFCRDGCFTRTFVMPCHRSCPGGNFTLDGLMHGRLDLVTRCITASFTVSFAIRRNTRYCVTLYDREGAYPCRTVTVDGSSAQHLRPAERELGALLLRLLAPAGVDGTRKLTKAQRKGRGSLHPRHGAWRPPTHMSPEEIAAAEERSRRCLVGLANLPHTFQQSVRSAVLATEAVQRGKAAVLLLLDEAAPLIDATTAGWAEHVSGGVVIVLGDNRGLTPEEEAYCDGLQAEGLVRVVRVSLGPVPLLASQCIVLIHHYLDRLAHTCNLYESPDKVLVARTPATLRGQQCLPVDKYDGWGAGVS